MNTVTPIAWVMYLYITYLLGDWLVGYLNEFGISLFVGMGLVFSVAALFVVLTRVLDKQNEIDKHIR